MLAEVSMAIERLGWRFSNAGKRCVSQPLAKSGKAAMRSIFVSVPARARPSADETSPKPLSSPSASFCPSGVSRTCRTRRSNNGPPTQFSSRLIWWLMAEGVCRSSNAASLKLCRCAAARNATRLDQGGKSMGGIMDEFISSICFIIQ